LHIARAGNDMHHLDLSKRRAQAVQSPPALQGGTPTDDKEMRDYRLTIDKVQKFVAAATAIQADAKASGPAHEVPIKGGCRIKPTSTQRK
jgi:hypothetical protein